VKNFLVIISIVKDIVTTPPIKKYNPISIFRIFKIKINTLLIKKVKVIVKALFKSFFVDFDLKGTRQKSTTIKHLIFFSILH